MAPRKVFEGQPEAKMFAFDNGKDFKNSLVASLNGKILELNKDAKGYNDQELQTYLNNHKNIDEVEPKPAGTTTPSGATNASASYKFTDKLYEQDAPTKPSGLVDPSGKPISSEQNKQPDQNATKEETKPTETANTGGVPKGNLAPFATPVTTWINENLMGFSLKKLQGMKPPSKVGQEDAFTAIAKNTKVTDKPESVAKLLRNIVNLPPDKKPDLIKIRDIIAGATGKKPDDLKNDIPL